MIAQEGFGTLFISNLQNHSGPGPIWARAQMLEYTKIGGDIFRLRGKWHRLFGGPKAAQWEGLAGQSRPRNRVQAPCAHMGPYSEYCFMNLLFY